MSRRPKVFLGFDYYVPAIHRGVVRAAGELDWHLLTNANDRATPADSRFDGILLQYGVDRKLDALADAHPGRVVDITRLAPHVALPRVTVDPAASGALAAGYLLDKGYREPVVVEGWHWGDPARLAAFEEKVATAGRRCAVWSLPEHAKTHPRVRTDTDVLETFFRNELAKTTGPIAVFCMHDTHAEILLRVARDMDFAVPGKLVVLGCDNDELVCEASRPPLTSIDLNFETVGYEAARLLNALMRDEPVAPRRDGVPPAGVTERASTGVWRTDNPVVRAALDRLERADGDRTDVDALARAAGVNRRAFERVFRATLGCTPLEFMIRRRVERAAQLMRNDPSMSGPQVAERLGYGSLAHFYRQFSSVKGVSVEEFRRHETAYGAGRRRPAPAR